MAALSWVAASKDNFKSCLQACSAAKFECSAFFSYKPREFSFRPKGKEVIFLAPVENIGNNVFSVSADDDTLTRKKLCSPEGGHNLTRSEQLLRERMRASGSGITDYKYIPDIDSILANTGTACTLFSCGDDQQVKSFPSLPGALDYKLCPGNSDILACAYEGDLWLLTTYNDEPIQITNTKALHPQRKVMAGQSSFVLQEEFDRYTAYWWDPASGKTAGTYKILYEEIDETDVEVLHTFNPSSQEIEDYSYPRPGKKNAVSVLKCLEITLEFQSGKFSVETLVLASSISAYLSKWEYLTRLGWLSNGKNIWVQVLDRIQHNSQFLLISADSFVKEGDCKTVFTPFILWKEEMSLYWISIKNTSCFEFFPTNDESFIKLLITSEEDGYPHLVQLKLMLPLPSHVTSTVAEPILVEKKVERVTFGDWNVMDSEVWIDGKENVVFFAGNEATPLEKHLYAVDLANQTLPCCNPVQLTPSNYYHDISVSVESQLFVSCYSNRTTAPAVAVYSFSIKPLGSQLLFHLSDSIELPLDFNPPIPFTATASSGETLHGVVYPPATYKYGMKYPTVLYVYGGPEFQVVKNDFSRFLMKVKQWTTCGFSVVMIDNRGSSNRGKKFESYIQYNMGSVEIEDQVVGLQAAVKAASCVDIERVAILGWSYGGYMALLGIAKRPDVFKICISGAPVTDYRWYDTGYTERYLGIPGVSLNKAYDTSSVVALASKFPNKPGKVLIIHGMNDENVLYTHTSLLLDALIEAGKPYQIQMYNGERHGIRNPTSALHCDAAILQFLLANL